MKLRTIGIMTLVVFSTLFLCLEFAATNMSFSGFFVEETLGQRPYLRIVVDNLALYCIFFVVGFVFYALLNARFNVPAKIHIFPLYVATGIMLTTIFSFVAAFLMLNRVIVGLFLALVGIFFVLMMFKRIQRSNLNVSKMIKNAHFQPNNLRTLIFLAIMVYTILHFSRITYQMGVSPIGDSLTHNMVSSWMIMAGKYPESYEPLIEMPFSILSYNRGFQTLNVFVAHVLGLMPIHSSIVITSILSQTLLLLSFSLTYYITKKNWLSFFVFILFLMVPEGTFIPPWSGNDPTLGNLVNGTYPQLLGYVFLLLLFTIIYSVDLESSENHLLEVSHPKLKLFVVGLISLSTATAAYRFLPLILISLLFFLHRSYTLKGKGGSWTEILFASAFVVTLLAIPYFAREIVQESLNLHPGATTITLSYLLTKALYSSMILLTASMIVLTRVLIRKSTRICDAVVVTTLLLIIASINNEIYENFLWYLSPARTLLTLFILSMLCLSEKISIIENKVTSVCAQSKIPIGRFSRILPLIVLLSLLLPNLYGLGFNATYVPPTWMRPLGVSYQAITTLLNNAASDDLILNDPTWTGMSITSFRAQNVVFERTISLLSSEQNEKEYFRFYKTRASECLRIFLIPHDYESVKEILDKYGIKYVFISPYAAFFDFDAWEYFFKTSEPYDRYLSYFDENPHLSVIFEENNVRVYKVRDNGFQ